MTIEDTDLPTPHGTTKPRLTTIAEGVENQDQVATLRAQGCREAQGFLYWSPMSAQALHGVIKQQREVA